MWCDVTEEGWAVLVWMDCNGSYLMDEKEPQCDQVDEGCGRH